MSQLIISKETIMPLGFSSPNSDSNAEFEYLSSVPIPIERLRAIFGTQNMHDSEQTVDVAPTTTKKSFGALLRKMTDKYDAEQKIADEKNQAIKEDRRQFQAWKREVIREVGGAKPPQELLESLWQKRMTVKEAANRIRHPFG